MTDGRTLVSFFPFPLHIALYPIPTLGNPSPICVITTLMLQNLLLLDFTLLIVGLTYTGSPTHGNKFKMERHLSQGQEIEELSLSTTLNSFPSLNLSFLISKMGTT